MNSLIALVYVARKQPPHRRSLFLSNCSSSSRISHRALRALQRELRQPVALQQQPRRLLLHSQQSHQHTKRSSRYLTRQRVRSAHRMSLEVVQRKLREAQATMMILRRTLSKTMRIFSCSRIRRGIRLPQVAGLLQLSELTRASIHCAWKSSTGLKMSNTHQEGRYDLSRRMNEWRRAWLIDNLLTRKHKQLLQLNCLAQNLLSLPRAFNISAVALLNLLYLIFKLIENSNYPYLF